MARNKIPKLSEAEKTALHEGYLHGKSPVFRMRCHIILLKSQGYISKDIAALHGYPTQTSINSWVNRYLQSGISGLSNKKGQGRKAILNAELDSEQIRKSVQAERQRLNMAKEELEKELSKNFSTKTLQRFLKKISVPINEYEKT
jgi:transposase